MCHISVAPCKENGAFRILLAGLSWIGLLVCMVFAAVLKNGEWTLMQCKPYIGEVFMSEHCGSGFNFF